MSGPADRSSEMRARVLRPLIEREWLPVLASLPLAIASFEGAAQIVAIVARAMVPRVGDAIAIDRLDGSEIRREHALEKTGHAPIDRVSAAMERALCSGRHELEDDTMIIAVPSAGVPRAIALRSSTVFTEGDLAHANVLAQWLAYSLSLLSADAEPAIDAMRAAAVHDLLNPLTIISVNAKGLRSVRDQEVVDARLALIERSARRMHDIAVDFLDDVRRATDRVSLDLAWCYVGELFSEAVECLRDAARVRQIGIMVSDCEGVVLCDRARIVQVLVNLLDNAVKYTERGGLISVDATREGGRTRVSVSDNGRGIAPAHLSRLFQRYWRSSSGTGIGLATARAFTAAHDSELQVTSVLGGGTTFWFDLHSAE
jgi:signal transduction histidine kinase